MQIFGSGCSLGSVSGGNTHKQNQYTGHNKSRVVFGREVRFLLAGSPVAANSSKEHLEPCQHQTVALPFTIPVEKNSQLAEKQKHIDECREIKSLLTGTTRIATKLLPVDSQPGKDLPESTENSPVPTAPFVSAGSSKIDGKGAFAGKDFVAGEKVGEYTGKTVLSYPCKQHPEHFYVAEIIEEGLERDNIAEKIQYRNNDTFVVWTGIDLKGTPMEFGVDGTANLKYLNHSKKPNVKLNVNFEGSAALWSEKDKVKVSVIALKNIKSGEELCFDYLHGNKKKINFGKNLVVNADDSEEVRYAIESILPVTIFGKKGYVIEQGEKRKLCDVDVESTGSILKRMRQTKNYSEQAGVSIDVIDADTRKSFHKSMPEEKWNRYGKLWNYIGSDGNRELDNKNKKILKELIDDINNEGLDLEYRLKLLHTTEYFWVVDNMEGDWKTCIKPKMQVIKNTAIAAGVTEDILKATDLADFHDENELSDTVWRLCANQWNRLSDGHPLNDHDRKALKGIQELVSDRSELSVALKNKLRHTTNFFWAEAGYSVDWQLYVSSVKPETAVKPKKAVKEKKNLK
ncbi:SET domain-containing protein-lysine N-methyltransferase [Endozoicomonas euniceicola]|uniref:SET domain-containing protein-lysine N-methyltransferase n=1 Tax=Endozoicomonas euniceicola TaxID=1234143 RepID=A0ABY6GZG2_9GAMM|nr:SET domain-containing protein-lysine N-methyltransferase [Endozoicomonas euniceicola]UYM17284.1 SET domain-containing protein-lysine N-methyltransferase [Endozoicomonas euniceicola]